jgi:hypothetical protein
MNFKPSTCSLHSSLFEFAGGVLDVFKSYVHVALLCLKAISRAASFLGLGFAMIPMFFIASDAQFNRMTPRHKVVLHGWPTAGLAASLYPAA